MSGLSNPPESIHTPEGNGWTEPEPPIVVPGSRLDRLGNQIDQRIEIGLRTAAVGAARRLANASERFAPRAIVADFAGRTDRSFLVPARACATAICPSQTSRSAGAS